MRTALVLLAFVLIAGGGASLLSGLPIVMMERGVALVIAGTVALTGGAILLGVVAVLSCLAALSRSLRTALLVPPQPTVAAPSAPEPRPAVSQPTTPDSARAPAAAPVPAIAPEPAAPVEEAPAERQPIVGSYETGNDRYVMFLDGSIEATTPEGVRRFPNLSALKAFSGRPR